MDIAAYPHSMDPFKHQRDHFEAYAEEPARGLLWEQGTAKTKPIVDTAIWLYLKGLIDCVIIVAPPGVERNWRSDEIPKHAPPEYANEIATHVFLTAKKHTMEHKAQLKRLRAWPKLAILMISYNAFMTKEGKNSVWKFLRGRTCMIVADEAHYIKTPGAKRTQTLIAAAKYAPYRRILTGTPIAVGPFDLYSQLRFIKEDIWHEKRLYKADSFRKYFGRWMTRAEYEKIWRYDPKRDILIEYCRMDELKEIVDQYCDRYLKTDVLDLPPKLYQKAYVQMSKGQQAIYDQLKDEGYAMLEDGTEIDAELAIVNLLRRQQVLSGYLPTDNPEAEEPYVRIDKHCPRLGIVEEWRDAIHAPMIIWSRFTEDISQICDMLGSDAVRYDGTMSDDDAERSKLAFQAGDVKFFVGNAQKGAEGLTLHQAKFTGYYANSFNYIHRRQSEDRNHRAGMDDNPVTYIDVCCPDSVDTKIVRNMQNKHSIASEILGDEWAEWI